MAQSIPVAVIWPPVCRRSPLIGHVALFSSPEEPVTCLSTPKNCDELPDARTPASLVANSPRASTSHSPHEALLGRYRTVSRGVRLRGLKG